MKLDTLKIIGLAALLAAPASAAARTMTPPAQSVRLSDSSLEEMIDKKLDTDASLKKFDVDVEVKDGVATLTGTVQTAAQKTRAESLAKVTGINQVVNNVAVDKNWKPATEKTKDAIATAAAKTKEGTVKAAEKTKEGTVTAAEKTKEGTVTAAEKTKEAAGTATEKTKSAVSKTGEVINDTWITTKVKTSFVDEDLLKGSDISVGTNNHVVTLKGTVASAAGKARAVEIARTTDGVTKVVDTLKIK